MGEISLVQAKIRPVKVPFVKVFIDFVKSLTKMDVQCILVVMAKKQTEIQVLEETLADKIYIIRNHKVMVDRDLARLYGVETKRLKEAVKRNINRFPEDFMFEMNKAELILRIWGCGILHFVSQYKVLQCFQASLQ